MGSGIHEKIFEVLKVNLIFFNGCLAAQDWFLLRSGSTFIAQRNALGVQLHVCTVSGYNMYLYVCMYAYLAHVHYIHMYTYIFKYVYILCIYIYTYMCACVPMAGSQQDSRLHLATIGLRLQHLKHNLDYAPSLHIHAQ